MFFRMVLKPRKRLQSVLAVIQPSSVHTPSLLLGCFNKAAGRQKKITFPFNEMPLITSFLATVTE